MRLTILKVDVEGTQDEVAEAVDMIVRQLCGRAMDEDVPARNETTAPVGGEAASEPAALPAGQQPASPPSSLHEEARPISGEAEAQSPLQRETAACLCDEIRDSMADGCHNPEGAEEHRQSHGHYSGCAAGPVQQAEIPGKDAQPADQGEASDGASSPSPVRAGLGETEYEWHRETGTRRLTIDGLMNATGLTRQAVHNATHRQKEQCAEWAKAKGYQFRKAVPAGSIENRPAVPPVSVTTAPEARKQARDDTPRYVCEQRPGKWGYSENVADLAGASVSLVRNNEGIAGAGNEFLVKGLTFQRVHADHPVVKGQAPGFTVERSISSSSTGETRPRHSLSTSTPINPHVIGGGARIPGPRDPEPVRG